MAGEMFGGPAGAQIAAEEQRRTGLSQIQALETMGKIAAQPGEAALRAAQTRLQGAEAGLKEQDLEVQRVMAAAGRSGAFAAGEGGSLADPLLKMAEIADANGFINKGIDLRMKASTVLSQEASADNARSNKQLHDLQIRQATLEQNARKAAEVLNITTQEDFDNWKMSKVNGGNDVSDMPVNLVDAQRLMRPIYQGSIKAAEAAQLEQTKVRDAETARRVAAQVRASEASAEASAARRDVLTDILARRKKNDGDVSAATRELKLERTRASKVAARDRAAANLAKDIKDFPLLPLDPDRVELGQSYTARGGIKVHVIGRDAKGVPILQRVAAPTRAAADSSAVSDDNANEGLDDDE